jgi:hypothetical protein
MIHAASLTAAGKASTEKSAVTAKAAAMMAAVPLARS